MSTWGYRCGAENTSQVPTRQFKICRRRVPVEGMKCWSHATTPLERAERITGIVLMPWQRTIAEAVLRGEQLVLHRGRQVGMSTIKKVVDEAQSPTATKRRPPRHSSGALRRSEPPGPDTRS